MDPISAFTLAGTVVTFVEFSSKLVKGANNLYKTTSGALLVHEELELVTSDLQSVIKKIQAFHATPKSAVHDVTQPAKDASFKEGFDKMCVSATELAEELLQRLETLKLDPATKGTRRVWNSLSQAMSSVWSSKELAALASRLKDLKELLEFRVLLYMSMTLDALSRTISEGLGNLDQHTQYIISALAQSSVLATSNESTKILNATLAKFLARIETTNSYEHRKTRDLMISSRQQAITPSVEMLEVPFHEENKIRTSVTREILKSLDFETRTHRLEQISDAHQATFNWVFTKTTLDQKPWYNFSEWLQHKNGVYWIQGKAGSGKSTLMSSIYQDPRTRQFLNGWGSKDTPLYIGSFFFWLSGTREQKSLQGLLRSILFEILSEEPNLVAIVLPRQWAESYTLAVAHDHGLKILHWSLKSLKDAFRLLIHQNIIPFKLCLFIDGLDEFGGDHCDYEELAELFKGITNDNVKVCLSSRPLVVFTECFRGLPSLRLQDLTRPDIEAYVYQTLSDNSFFKLLALGHEVETTIFKRYIVEMAEGVFLWVTLVVRSLLSGIRNRDAIPDLQLRLLRFPKELEPLYTHLLDRIEPGYFPWAAKAFQIVRAVQEHVSEVDNSESVSNLTLSLLDFHMSIEEGIELPLAESWTGEQLNRECDDANTYIAARCAGLLETVDYGTRGPLSRVQFLHRTARDYIYEPSKWSQIVSVTGTTSFNPNVSLIRAYALQSNIRANIPGVDFEICIRKALTFGRAADTGQFQTPTAILDMLFSGFQKGVKRQLRRVEKDKLPWLHRVSEHLPPFESFLSIAARFGFTNFLLRQPVEARSRLTTDGASLLHYAIPKTEKEKVNVEVIPCASTIRLLLQTCDMNLSYKGVAPWEQVLNGMNRIQSTQWRGYSKILQVESVMVLIRMLQAGADPRRPSTDTGASKHDVVDIMWILKKSINSQESKNSKLREHICELEAEVNKALENTPIVSYPRNNGSPDRATSLYEGQKYGVARIDPGNEESLDSDSLYDSDFESLDRTASPHPRDYGPPDRMTGLCTTVTTSLEKPIEIGSAAYEKVMQPSGSDVEVDSSRGRSKTKALSAWAKGKLLRGRVKSSRKD